MARKFERAFSNWPRTTLLKDGGVHLTGRYTHPKLYWRGPAWFFIVVFVLALVAWGKTDDFRMFVATIVAVTICWFLFLRRVFFAAFGKKLDIKVYHDRIALPGWLWTRNYSRDAPLEFRVEQHRKALKERGPHRIFRNAVETVMQYGEKRIPLAEMPEKDIDKAHALILRLQNVCESLDAATAIAGGANMKPVAPGDFGPVPEIR